MYEAWPLGREPVDIAEHLRGRIVPTGPLFAGKRVLLLGMPGAFTPNCHKMHLPGYVKHADEFFAAGVDDIIVMVSNDTFCARAWGEQLGAIPKIRLLSDTHARVAKSVGLALDAHPTVGRVVVHRFSALLEDGVVKLLLVEHGGLGVTCSAAVPMLCEVKSKKYEEILGPDALWKRGGDGSLRRISVSSPTATGTGMSEEERNSAAVAALRQRTASGAVPAYQSTPPG